jgi:hypothetical protein
MDRVEMERLVVYTDYGDGVMSPQQAREKSREDAKREKAYHGKMLLQEHGMLP